MGKWWKWAAHSGPYRLCCDVEFNFFLIIHLFGCTGFWLHHMRFLLHHVRSFDVVHGLSSYGAQASTAIVHELSSERLWDLSSLARDQTHVSCIARQIFYHWTTRDIL